MVKNIKKENDNPQINQIDTELKQSKSNIISGFFNLFASKNRDSKIERALDFVSDVLKIAPQILNHFNLNAEKKHLLNSVRLNPDEDRKIIQNWYDENPQYQATASPEFRKPNYPVLKDF